MSILVPNPPSQMAALITTLRSLPIGFTIQAPLSAMLAISDEAGAPTWKALSEMLNAEITCDGFSGYLTLTPR